VKDKDSGKSITLLPLVSGKSVDVEFRSDHIHIDLGKGLKVSSEQRNSLWDLIGRICEEHGTKRVLVEGTPPKGVFQTSEVIDAGLKTATVRSFGWRFVSPTLGRMSKANFSRRSLPLAAFGLNSLPTLRLL
jgi:hypothetical protein